jgi:CRP-like cAMP-binding protein
MALLGNSPRSASIQALTACEFARIDEKRFLYLITMTPGFAITVMRVMAQRLQAANVNQATPATNS